MCIRDRYKWYSWDFERFFFKYFRPALMMSDLRSTQPTTNLGQNLQEIFFEFLLSLPYRSCLATLCCWVLGGHSAPHTFFSTHDQERNHVRCCLCFPHRRQGDDPVSRLQGCRPRRRRWHRPALRSPHEDGARVSLCLLHFFSPFPIGGLDGFPLRDGRDLGFFFFFFTILPPPPSPPLSVARVRSES